MAECGTRFSLRWTRRGPWPLLVVEGPLNGQAVALLRHALDSALKSSEDRVYLDLDRATAIDAHAFLEQRGDLAKTSRLRLVGRSRQDGPVAGP